MQEFFTFFKRRKWYQIAKSILASTNRVKKLTKFVTHLLYVEWKTIMFWWWETKLNCAEKKHKSSSLNYKRKGFAALKTFFLRRKIIIAKSTGILWMCGRQKKSQGWNIICSQLSIQVFLTTYKSSGLKYYFQSAIKAIMVFSSWRPLQCLHFPIAKKHMKALQ